MTLVGGYRCCAKNDIRDKMSAREMGAKHQLNKYNVLCDRMETSLCDIGRISVLQSLCKNATIHQVTTMQATSKHILFTGHNHQLTTSTDDSLVLW